MLYFLTHGKQLLLNTGSSYISMVSKHEVTKHSDHKKFILTLMPG